jgi:hypothetical protein
MVGQGSMTDEERQRLCKWLLQCAGVRSDGEAKGMIDAADELERLAKELEESRKNEIKFRIQEPQEWVIRND